MVLKDDCCPNHADGRTKILLYTERAHFYHRGRTKGVQVALLTCAAMQKLVIIYLSLSLEVSKH